MSHSFSAALVFALLLLFLAAAFSALLAPDRSARAGVDADDMPAAASSFDQLPVGEGVPSADESIRTRAETPTVVIAGCAGGSERGDYLDVELEVMVGRRPSPPREPARGQRQRPAGRR